MYKSRKDENRKKSTAAGILRRVLLILAIVLVVSGAAFLIYTSRFYHAGETAENYTECEDRGWSRNYPAGEKRLAV